MASGVHIGGADGGLQHLAGSGTRMSKMQAASTLAKPAFSAHLKAMQGIDHSLSTRAESKAASDPNRCSGTIDENTSPLTPAKEKTLDAKTAIASAGLRAAIAPVSKPANITGLPQHGVQSATPASLKGSRKLSSEGGATLKHSSSAGKGEAAVQVPLPVPSLLFSAIQLSVGGLAAPVALHGAEGSLRAEAGVKGSRHGRELKASAGPAIGTAKAEGNAGASGGGSSPLVVAPGQTASAGFAPKALESGTSMIAGAIMPATLSASASPRVDNAVTRDVDPGTHESSPVGAHMTRYEEEGRGGTDLSDARTLVSTPNALEVGITGGAHGWLRVRAELEHTGEVTASLVASSAASAEALHQELSSMSAYLKNEVVGVSSLTVSAPESSGAMHGFGSQATPGGMTSGAGGDGAAHGGAASEGSRGDGKQSLLLGMSSLVTGLAPGYAGAGVPAALLGSGVGGWLNVRV